MAKKDKWKKRREEIKETMEEMDDQIESYFETPEQLAEYLEFMSKMYDYSLRNVAMIQRQFPGANAVGSFKFWNEKGFFVNKGEKGIKILVPIKSPDRFKTEEGKTKNVKYATKEELEKIEQGKLELTKGRVYFKFGHVFDISQTNAKAEDLPEIFPNKWMEGKVDNYNALMNSFKKIADDLNVTVGDPLDELGTAKGAFYHAIGKDTVGHIGLNPRNSELQNVKTMIHELAHAKLHAGDKGLKMSTEEKEFQAEMVAYSTASYFGIDTSDYSLQYLASWTKGKELKDKEMLLKEVQETSLEFIKTIEEELLKDKEVIRSKQIVTEWAKDIGLEHSSSEHYDDFISHIFVYEDSLIDINDDGNGYELIASKEVDDFKPYLEAESDTLEGLDPYINEIKYGKSLTKNNDKGLEM